MQGPEPDIYPAGPPMFPPRRSLPRRGIAAFCLISNITELFRGLSPLIGEIAFSRQVVSQAVMPRSDHCVSSPVHRHRIARR